MIDPRERFSDDEEAIRIALAGHQAGLWTALPGIVQTVNMSAMTVTIKPSIMGIKTNADGTISNIQLPLLGDVPIVFPNGGGNILTFPVASGDEALVIFAARCIDGWWQQGGIQPQTDQRLHDLSDGFAIIGPKSQPNVISSISTTAVQLRNNSGNTYLEIDPIASAIDVIGLNGITLTGGGKTLTINSSGITIDGILFESHLHTGVQTGGSDSGPPVGGSGGGGGGGGSNNGTVTNTITAGATIVSGMAVAQNSSLQLIPASNASLSSAAGYIGIATQSGGTGTSLTVTNFGPVQDTGWAWTIGQPVFLSTSGGLTQTAPTSGVLLAVGNASASNQINLSQSFSIQL